MASHCASASVSELQLEGQVKHAARGHCNSLANVGCSLNAVIERNTLHAKT